MKRNFSDRITLSLAGFGFTQLLGIPFLWTVVATALDAFSIGASKASDAIESISSREAESLIDFRLSHGASVEGIEVLDDGTVHVKYNLANYTGPNFEHGAYGEIDDSAIDALSDNWF